GALSGADALGIASSFGHEDLGSSGSRAGSGVHDATRGLRMHPRLPLRAGRDDRPGPGWPRAGGEGARAASARSEWGPWRSDRTGDVDSSTSAVACPAVARMLPPSLIRSAPPGQGRDSASRAVTVERR